MPATTSWPSTLPTEPLRGSLVVAQEDNIVEFKPDVGSPIRRRRYTGRRVAMQCEMTLTEAQRRELDSFYSDDCADGSVNFTMTDWIDGTTQTFSWAAAPQFQHVMVEIFRVSLSIVREPV
jgi:hypothetical protein